MIALRIAPMMVLLGALPFSATAQPIGSAPRAITLIAVKRPVEPFDAVRVVTQPISPADSAAGLAVRAVVEVRADMPCEIRVRTRGAAPVTAFRGQCRASEAGHDVALGRAGDSSGGAGAATATTVEVVGWMDGAPRRWVVEVAP